MTAVMDLIAAVLLGLAGGFAEFLLLRRTVDALLSGSAAHGMLLFFAKLAVLFAVLLPVAFLYPEALGVCGLCIAVPLVVCSSVAFFRSKGAKAGAGAKTEEKTEEKNDD